MKSTTSDEKAAVNDQSFQELLSAAWVVQQHHDRLQTGQVEETGSSGLLREILELQEQLRGTDLDLREKAALVARRVREMAQGSGSAVGIVAGSRLDYVAATGSAASEAGARVLLDASLAAECLRSGKLLQSAVAESDPRINSDLCRVLSVKALIAAPVLHGNKVAGVLEIHFAEPNSFHEQEVRTCQLAAALLGETIVKGAARAQEPRSLESSSPSTSAGSHAAPQDKEALLAVLERIRPKLEHLARNPKTILSPPAEIADEVQPRAACRDCGHPMGEDEIFCGTCGSPRQTQKVWSSLLEMQRRAEGALHGTSGENAAGDESSEAPLDLFPSELEEIVSKFSGESFEKSAETSSVVLPTFAEGLVAPPPASSTPETYSDESFHQSEDSNLAEESVIRDQSEVPSTDTERDSEKHAAAQPFLVPPAPEPSADDSYPPFAGFASDTNLLSLNTAPEEEKKDSDPPAEEHAYPDWTQKPSGTTSSGTAQLLDFNAPWGSAAKTKEWLEVQRRNSAWLSTKWQQQRANVYLAAAAILLLAVLAGLGAPSQQQAGLTKSGASDPKTPPQPELTVSERLLVSLGLADPPSPPTYQGNPDTQVWVDVHTALYYCPGTDLYGKTADGRTETQKSAQLEDFQPAARKPCD